MGNNIKYISGDWTVATPVGALRFESPLLPELNEVLIAHQDFVQNSNNWAALDYNTINTDIVGGDPFYLFNESPREDYGGNMVKWTRSWARVPSSYGKAGGTYPFNFPSFLGGRNSFLKPVALQIVRDFFLCGNFGTFTTWQDIPIIRGFRPYNVQDDPTDTSWDSENILADPGDSIVPGLPELGTNPSLSAYRALIAGGQFIDVEDSKVVNWRGGIYMRERYLVLAQ